MFAVGGGGNGGSMNKCTYWSVGSGGGGGGYTSTGTLWVSPGASIPVTVGANNSSSNVNYNGIISANGGNTIDWTSNNWSYIGINGASGGSGGGGGGHFNGGQPWRPGNGASDGQSASGSFTENGYDSAGNFSSKGGTGQGTTTRAFGESTGTLYSGGGGGAAYHFSMAFGGSGGGGNGGYEGGGLNGVNGGYATGGGGGGCCNSWSFNYMSYSHDFLSYGTPGTGGSGCVIIRWG